MHENDGSGSQTTTVSRLDGAMSMLDSRSRHIMELWLEGMSPRQIADTLGLSERTVMVLRTSSLWRLRELLAMQAPTEEADMPEMNVK